MTTRDSSVTRLAAIINACLHNVTIGTTDRVYLRARLEEAQSLVAEMANPPAPAAITEAMVEAGAKAIGAYMYSGRSWESLVATQDMWLNAARTCLKAAAQAQPGGEASA